MARKKIVDYPDLDKAVDLEDLLKGLRPNMTVRPTTVADTIADTGTATTMPGTVNTIAGSSLEDFSKAMASITTHIPEPQEFPGLAEGIFLLDSEVLGYSYQVREIQYAIEHRDLRIDAEERIAKVRCLRYELVFSEQLHSDNLVIKSAAATGQWSSASVNLTFTDAQFRTRYIPIKHDGSLLLEYQRPLYSQYLEKSKHFRNRVAAQLAENDIPTDTGADEAGSW